MSAFSAYNYESTASARPLSRPQSPRKPLRVLPGHAKRPAVLTPTVLMLAKVAAVALVVLAALSFARIALKSATVALTMESQKISASVDSARSEASTLELTASALASPDRVKSEATDAGMIASQKTEIMTLNPDVLVVDDTGAISLSGSVGRVALSG